MAKKTKAARVAKKTKLRINGFEVRPMRVSDLDAAYYNPREIRDFALRGLKASVDRFGLTQPIIWNLRTKRVVGGHQRLKTLGDDDVTDVVVVDLDDEREKLLNLALNNPHSQGQWTEELSSVLQSIEEGLPDLMGDLNLDELVMPAPDPAPPVLDPPGGGGDPDPVGCDCPRCGHTFQPGA